MHQGWQQHVERIYLWTWQVIVDETGQYQIQLILTTSDVRCHTLLWDNRSTRQL